MSATDHLKHTLLYASMSAYAVSMQVHAMPTMLHAGGRAPEIEEKKRVVLRKETPSSGDL